LNRTLNLHVEIGEGVEIPEISPDFESATLQLGLHSGRCI
jgi:hypothetical protein